MIINDLEEEVWIYASSQINNHCAQIISAFLGQYGCRFTDEYNEFKIDIYMLFDDPSSNVIAIDWDNTYTLMPEVLLGLIKVLKQQGYRPIICTLREDDAENQLEFKRLLCGEKIDIYCTDGVPKRHFVSDRGESVHLWIDDYFPGICQFSSHLIKKNHIYGLELDA